VLEWVLKYQESQMSAEHSDPIRTPIDFEAAQKGDIVPAERLERLTGVKRHEKEYALKVLPIKQQIERGLAEMNKHMTVIMRGDDLVLLTDEEASEYNERKSKEHLRGFCRSYVRLRHVDVAGLPDDARRAEHTRRLEVAGAYLVAFKDAQKKLGPVPHKRQTPGLPGNGNASTG
jgi:hypothetical protein